MAVYMSSVGETLLLFFLLHSRALHMVPTANSSVGSDVVLIILSRKPDIEQKVLEMIFAGVLHDGKSHLLLFYTRNV